MESPIHANLKILRDYLKLSQSEFGAPFGISRQVINNYEHFQVPPANVLAAICSHYGFNLKAVAEDDLVAAGIQRALVAENAALEQWLIAKMDLYDQAGKTEKRNLYKNAVLDMWLQQQSQ